MDQEDDPIVTETASAIDRIEIRGARALGVIDESCINGGLEKCIDGFEQFPGVDKTNYVIRSGLRAKSLDLPFDNSGNQ